MPSTRLPVTQLFAPRQATPNSITYANKDGLLKNCYTEKTPIGDMIVKRPGLTVTAQVPAGCAQGSFVLNGTPYFIVDQFIYGIPGENPVTGGGGGGGGGGSINAADWSLVGTIAQALSSNADGASMVSYGGTLFALPRSATILRAWSSANDGATWTDLGDTNIAEAVGTYQSMVVFGGVMVTATTTTRRALSSVDGITWTLLGTIPATNYRVYGLVVMGSFLYALLQRQGFTSQIWRSSDGITWTQMSGTITNGNLTYSSLATLNGNLYIIGGLQSPTAQAIVLESTDNGATWTTLTTGAAFGGIWGAFSWGISDRLYMAGGITNSSTESSSVYVSADGITWSLATASAAFGARSKGAMCVHDNKLYLGPSHTFGSSNSVNTVYRALENYTTHSIPF